LLTFSLRGRGPRFRRRIPDAADLAIEAESRDMPLIKAAIFDFDGVLVNTIPLHFRSFRELFREQGVEFTFDDYRRVANGVPRDRVIKAVLGENLRPELFARLMRRKEDLILDLLDREGIQAIDGAMELVERLRALGLRLGVASSSRTAARFLSRLGAAHLFHAVTDASETVRAKPDPEVFLTTARKLEVGPAQCLVFEDAPLGVAAARAAGMKVVAITSTTSADQLHEADLVIDSFVGLDPLPLLSSMPSAD
jgi:beta-phosphoglucomutase